MIHRLILPLVVLSLVGCASTPEPTAGSPTTTTSPARPMGQQGGTTVVQQPGVTGPSPNAAQGTQAGSGSNEPALDRRLRAQITNAARKPYDKLLVCYHDAIRRDKSTSGTVSINLTVAPSGEPVVIEDNGSTVKDNDFVTCVRSVLSKSAYPRWQGKAVSVVINYDFTREVADPPVRED